MSGPTHVQEAAPGLVAPAPRSRVSPGARRAIAIGAWLVATLLVVVALRTVGVQATLAAASQARVPWLVVASLCHLLVIVLWAAQTWLLLPDGVRGRFGRIFEVQAITAAAQNTIPAFLGQATGVAVLAERGGAGTAAALSVLAQHSLIEALAKLVTLELAAQVAPLPPWMQRAVTVLGVVLAGLALTLFAAAWAARRGVPRADDAFAARRLRTAATRRRAPASVRACAPSWCRGPRRSTRCARRGGSRSPSSAACS